MLCIVFKLVCPDHSLKVGFGDLELADFVSTRVIYFGFTTHPRRNMHMNAVLCPTVHFLIVSGCRKRRLGVAPHFTS